MIGGHHQPTYSDDGWGDDPPCQPADVPQMAPALGGPQRDQMNPHAMEVAPSNEHDDTSIDLSIKDGEELVGWSDGGTEHVESVNVPEEQTPQNTRHRFHLDKNETPILRQWGDDTSVTSSFWHNEHPLQAKDNGEEHRPSATSYFFRPDSPVTDEIPEYVTVTDGEQTRRVFIGQSTTHGHQMNGNGGRPNVGRQRNTQVMEDERRPKATKHITYAEFAGWTKWREASQAENKAKTVEIGENTVAKPSNRLFFPLTYNYTSESADCDKENRAPPKSQDISTSSMCEKRDCSVQTIVSGRGVEDKGTQTSPVIIQPTEIEAFTQTVDVGTNAGEGEVGDEGGRQNGDDTSTDVEMNIMEQAKETEVEEEKEGVKIPPCRPNVALEATTSGRMQLAKGIRVGGGEVATGQRGETAPFYNSEQAAIERVSAPAARTNVNQLAFNAMLSVLQGIEATGQKATETLAYHNGKFEKK